MTLSFMVFFLNMNDNVLAIVLFENCSVDNAPLSSVYLGINLFPDIDMFLSNCCCVFGTLFNFSHYINAHLKTLFSNFRTDILKVAR